MPCDVGTKEHGDRKRDGAQQFPWVILEFWVPFFQEKGTESRLKDEVMGTRISRRKEKVECIGTNSIDPTPSPVFLMIFS